MLALRENTNEMDWSTLIVDGGPGLAAAGALIFEFFRRLLNGDIVLGREYDYLKSELTDISQKANQISSEQAETARRERQQLLDERQQLLDQIESQRKLLQTSAGWPPQGAQS